MLISILIVFTYLQMIFGLQSKSNYDELLVFKLVNRIKRSKLKSILHDILILVKYK